MKYANTAIINGIETVVTVLPLDMVPGFDPENPPQANTYAVPGDVQAGWIMESGVFFAPPVVVPPVVVQTPRACSSLQFMDRFTESEQLAIVSATMTVPQVKLWYDRMIAAMEIVYKDPRTIGGLQALVAAGLITQARMDVVLPLAWR